MPKENQNKPFIGYEAPDHGPKSEDQERLEQLVGDIGSRTDSIESEIDAALLPQESKSLWRKGADRIKEIFGKEGIDISKTLEEVEELKTSLSDLLFDDSISMDSEEIERITNAISQLDKIGIKITELEEKIDTDVIEADVEESVEKTEDPVEEEVEGVDSELDFARHDEERDLTIEGEGVEAGEMIDRVEEFANRAIADIEAIQDAFSNDSERMGEITRLQAEFSELENNRDNLRAKLLDENGKKDSLRGDADYQYLSKQCDTYGTLLKKLEAGMKDILELRELVQEIYEPTQSEEQMQALLAKAKKLLSEPRFAELQQKHLLDDAPEALPTNLGEAVKYVDATILSLDADGVDSRAEANEQIRLAEWEKKIDELEDLVIELSQAESNDDENVKKEALHKATEIINNDRYTDAMDSEDPDFVIPLAIEEATLVAREMITRLEQMKVSTNEEPGNEEPSNEEPLEDVESEKEATDLENAREAYFKALSDRRGIISTKRKLGVLGYRKGKEGDFEELKQKYEVALREEQKDKLEEKKEELRTAAAAEGEIPKELFDEYIKLLEEEESKIDGLATSKERSAFKKFQGFWRRHAKARLVTGIGIGAVGAAAALPALGLGAVGALFGATAFLAARGVVSGTGAYMGAEAAMDIGSKKLGQRGIIDDETKIGFVRSVNEIWANLPGRKGKGLIESQKVVDRIIEDYKDGDNVFEKYNIDELRAELARLRALSLDKGVELKEAGRLGAMHGDLIDMVRETYHAKLKKSIFDSGTDQESAPKERERITLSTLNEALDTEVKAAQSELVSQTDIDRKKKIQRHGVAAALGLTVGVVVGTGAAGHMMNKLRGVEADADLPAETPDTDVAAETPDASVEPEDTRPWYRKLGGKLGETETDATGTTPETPAGTAAADSTGTTPETPVDKATGAHGLRFDDGVAEGPSSEMHTAVSESTLGGQEAAGTVAADTTGTTPETPAGTTAPETSGTTPETPAGTTAVPAENVESIVEVAKGDTVWGIAKNELIDRLGKEKWAELGEAKQTFMIDAVKDKIVADPGTYGIDGDADILKVGMDIDIGQAVEDAGALDGLQEAAGNLSAEGMENIVDNNEAIAQAAKAGIKITSENVDQVAAEIRENGLEFLTDDGSIHEWTSGEFPVDKVGEDFVNAMTGEKIPADELGSVVDRAGDGVADNIMNDGVEGAGDKFSDQAFQEIMSSNEPAHIEEYLKDYISDKGWPNDKATVFLSSLKDSAGKINNNLGGVWTQEVDAMSGDGLNRVMESWEGEAVKGSFKALKVVDSNHWTPIKIGDHYHFAKKIALRFRSDVFMLDMDGDLNTEGAIKVSMSDMESAFETGTTALIDNDAPAVGEIGDGTGVFRGAADSAVGEAPELTTEIDTETPEPVVDTPADVEPKTVEPTPEPVVDTPADVEPKTVEPTPEPVVEPKTVEPTPEPVVDTPADVEPKTVEPTPEVPPEVSEGSLELSFDKLEASKLNFHESIVGEEQASLQETYQFAVDEYNSYIDQYQDYEALHGNDKGFGIIAKNAAESLKDSAQTISKLDAYISTGTGKQHINFDYLGPYEGDAESTPEFVAGMSLSGTLEASLDESLPEAELNTSVEPKTVEPTTPEPVVETPVSNENVKAVLQDLSKAYFEDGKSYTMDDILNLEGKQLVDFEDSIKKTVAILELTDGANVGKIEAYKHILDQLQTEKV